MCSVNLSLPLLSPLPEVPRLPPLGRMLFLFLQSVVPTVPASFLTFGAHPLYSFYAHVPRLWGISAISDMQVAGVIMIIGGLLQIAHFGAGQTSVVNAWAHRLVVALALS